MCFIYIHNQLHYINPGSFPATPFLKSYTLKTLKHLHSLKHTMYFYVFLPLDMFFLLFGITFYLLLIYLSSLNLTIIFSMKPPRHTCTVQGKTDHSFLSASTAPIHGSIIILVTIELSVCLLKQNMNSLKEVDQIQQIIVYPEARMYLVIQ